MNQQDIDELTEVFVEESEEIVGSLDKDVLELEQYVDSSTVNRDLVNNIFRYVHTLKGNSGLAGADKLRDLAHKMESLLDRLRKDKIALSAEIVDILFDGIDKIKAILKEVKTGIDQGVIVDDLIEKVEGFLTGQSAQGKEAPPPKSPIKGEKAKQAAEAVQPPAPSDVSQYPIPDSIKRILTEYEENRLLQSIRNNLRIYELILNLAMQGFDKVVTAVIDKINTIGEVIAKVPSSKTLPGYDLQVRILFASPVSVQQFTESLASVKELIPQDFSIKLLMEPLKGPPSSKTPSSAKPKTVKEKEVRTAEPQPSPSPSFQKKPVQEEVREPVPPSKPSPGKEFYDTTGNVVRVDIKKLDNLMNIVGELVLAKARYVQFESEIESISAYKMLRESFKRNNKLTSKKLEDLREAILQVRMVQVGSLFNRFPRIVRDLAKAHNKQIRLLLEGTETELDKAVIDEMGEPLIHLIRNAVDHGIEDQRTRRQKGKPEVGTITLRAYQEGSYIVIEMEDDGAGMNVERIREKAIEVGLIEKGIKLSESEILSFTFHPGFSTAKKVTNISGRGVGMDVVKLTITRLKGIIDIQTSLNVRTKFVIKLPLTLAIIQVLLIKVYTHTYAIPLSTVIESFRLDSEKIELVDEQEVTQLRNIVLPLLRLSEVFGLQKHETQSEELSPEHEKQSEQPESVTDDESEELFPEHEKQSEQPESVTDGESEEVFPEHEKQSGEFEAMTDESGKVHSEDESAREEPKSVADEPETVPQESKRESEEPQPAPAGKFVVVIGLAEKKIGLVVDELLGQQEIVIKPLGRYLVDTPGFAGATTLGDGKVVLILDVVGVIENLNQKKVNLRKQKGKQAISA